MIYDTELYLIHRDGTLSRQPERRTWTTLEAASAYAEATPSGLDPEHYAGVRVHVTSPTSHRIYRRYITWE